MKLKAIVTAPLVALLFLAVVACDDSETEYVYAPSISVAQAVISVPEEGGTGTVSYTISNPVEGGEVTASASSSWVSDLDTSASGTIVFTASANSNTDPRTSRITITYTYTIGGSRGTATADVTIAQSCGDQPAISVSPTAIAVETAGGNYSFDYVIVNPASDGKFECTSSVSWVSDLTVSGGTVSFKVSENVGALRTTKIEMTYSYGSREIYEYVTVVQNHEPGAEGNVDPNDVVGTYTAHGTVYGNGITSPTETDWDLRIYAYNGSDDKYEYWVDGLSPWLSGSYNENGDHRASAGAYLSSDGKLHIPSQVFNCTVELIDGSSYYLGFTPCTEYTGNGYMYSSQFPDLVLTYNDRDNYWSSDFGVFLATFNTESLSSLVSYVQVVHPTFTLTKRTSSTASTTSVDSDKTATVFEGLEAYFNINAE